MNKKISKQAGFTLVEVVLSLSITICIVFATAMILSPLRKVKTIETLNSSMEIGMKALSQDLYCARDIEYGTALFYTNDEEEQYSISVDNNRLVRKPGFLVYLHDVEEVYFYVENNNIYTKIKTKKTERIFWIGSDYQSNES